MKLSVREAFVGFSSRFEGVVRWMYQDIKGLVSTGIGNLIDPVQMAMQVPFMKGTEYASRAEIAAEWLRVKNDPDAARLGYPHCEGITQLRLNDGGLALIVGRKLAQNDAFMAHRFADWETWPADAQLATLSMCWACGPGFAFPRLEAALRAHDFSAAAAECHIQDGDNPGVRPRNAANIVCYRNAATMLAGGMDPEVLHWPADLSDEVTQPSIVPSRRFPVIEGFDIIHPDVDDEPSPESA